jgi:hypothetical protein
MVCRNPQVNPNHELGSNSGGSLNYTPEQITVLMQIRIFRADGVDTMAGTNETLSRAREGAKAVLFGQRLLKTYPILNK